MKPLTRKKLDKLSDMVYDKMEFLEDDGLVNELYEMCDQVSEENGDKPPTQKQLIAARRRLYKEIAMNRRQLEKDIAMLDKFEQLVDDATLEPNDE